MQKGILFNNLPDVPKKGQLKRLIFQALDEEWLIEAIKRHNIEVPNSCIEMIKGSGRAEE